MPLIFPNFDVKSLNFSKFWTGAFSNNCWKSPALGSLKYKWQISSSIFNSCILVTLNKYFTNSKVPDEMLQKGSTLIAKTKTIFRASRSRRGIVD